MATILEPRRTRKTRPISPLPDASTDAAHLKRYIHAILIEDNPAPKPPVKRVWNWPRARLYRALSLLVDRGDLSGYLVVQLLVDALLVHQSWVWEDNLED